MTARDGRVLSLLEDGRELVINPEGGHAPPGVPELNARWGVYFIFLRHTATRPLSGVFVDVAGRTWARDHPETPINEPR